MTDELKIGLGLWSGQHGDPTDAVALARAGEDAGFDSFWVTEHHGMPDGYLPSPLTVLAACASVTQRIELASGVVLAPLHHPLRLAEDAALVDRLSHGRLLLGLGLGYAAHEYAAFGVDPATRGARLEALVGALRAAGTGEPFDAPGLGLHDVRVTPTPARPIPLWLGGYAERALARAGRLADGHLVGRGEPAIVEAASRTLATVRDPADPTFVRGVVVTCVLDAPGGGAAHARAGFARAQEAYEAIQQGRAVFAGLADPARAADIDAHIQVRGDVDDVVTGLRAVLASLAAWSRVHLVVRVAFAEPDLDTVLTRVATIGERVLPHLR
ncbi:alkanesulfonate monooxygenase SsuD/methylene tetrahydromethanopterin reductase-like flavin-dependent oxidoreductase (luciferase family) [Actinomycetospora succinea]|uniref:Alkanesulfonate monooxygenase SsuD/methylene tetrahydromethanopterin reductase-like flavin-dependent oxidoreductase (Luciferase family) n=1 Tax=Actinomycetospora succinea TaxID=663603 RepID=A0A4V3D8J6_9PSEU|nr:LLM class flavin-dependent oxidoreductase [Actinomycetospora succinea]TDQ51817.1 alkanesulfonate monooxygenase SsuD/methylene tetrahydromethanopterin reductase-like flavin-dependent oxidoreductase (luciferase family) [Actinomycetospora succinea]